MLSGSCRYSGRPCCRKAHRATDHLHETNGKIQGVGAHRCKTTRYDGQPCIFVVDGDDLDAPIVNGPNAAHNGIDLPSLAPGDYPLVITVNGKKSNAGTMTVK